MLTDDIAMDFCSAIFEELKKHKEFKFSPDLMGDIYTYCENYVYHLYLDNYSTQGILKILDHHLKYISESVNDMIINARILDEKSLKYCDPASVIYFYFTFKIYQNDLIYSWSNTIPYKPISRTNLRYFFDDMYKKMDRNKEIEKNSRKTIYKQLKLF